MVALQHGDLKGKYTQTTVKKRIEALFLDNVGKVITREQIIKAATDPKTGIQPENWHQRLSELRTDDGYTIQSWRDRRDLKVQEYLMPSAEKRAGAGRRVRPTAETWKKVLENCGFACEWEQDGSRCGLRDGDADPIGGGTVKLTPDHKQPHSINPDADPLDPSQWQALCGRHQVMKKNYWDSSTGKINALAIIQSLPKKEKEAILEFLLSYFDYRIDRSGEIEKTDQ